MRRLRWQCSALTNANARRRPLSWQRARLHLPDLGGILSDRVVAGEFPAAGHVQDGLPCPCVAVGVQGRQLVVRLEIRLEVCKVHVPVSLGEQSIPQRSKDAWLIAAEITGEDQ